MDDDAPHQMRWPRVAARVAGYTILAVVLYVLSIGPVTWLLWWRSPTVDSWINNTYAPLFSAADRLGIKRPMDRYELWWGRLPGGSYERLSAQRWRVPPPSGQPDKP
jgi:hypothetical protein